MSVPSLIASGDPRLHRSERIGDSWAAIAPVDDPELRDTRARMRGLLAERPGHLTGSALFIDATAERTLLLFHTKLQIWVQPGGHADGDANLPAVALREAEEETGIEGLQIWPVAIDLDIHRVDPPKEDAHDHYDVRFLVLAPAGAVIAANHESQDQRWVTAAELPALGVDAGLRRMAERGFALARRLLAV